MVLEIRKGVEKLCNLLQNGDATFSIFICNFWYFYYAINSGEYDINDSFLICSDGLWNRVEDSELQKKALLQEDGVNQLIELARSRNEKDNISVIKITGINEEGISERNNQKVLLTGALSIMVITLLIILIMIIN